MGKNIKSRIKNTVGAPLGNTNALKRGYYSRAFREARSRQVEEFLDRCNQEGSLVNFMLLNIARVFQDDPEITLEDILSLNHDPLDDLVRSDPKSSITFHRKPNTEH